MAGAYERVLLKLSGEAFADPELGFGIDPRIVNSLADQLGEVVRELSIQVAVVVGGGNIFRGNSPAGPGDGPGARRLHGDAGHDHQLARAAGRA